MRIPAPLQDELSAFCGTWRLPQSVVLRDALQFALHHPGFLLELTSRAAYLEDPRTPEQQAAWVAYEQTLAAFDVAATVAQLTPPVAGDDLSRPDR